VKTSTEIGIQSENYPNASVADGRSMQNGINITKRNKQDNKYSIINQISSCQLHFFLFYPTTAQQRALVSFFLVSRHVLFYGKMLSAPRPAPNLTGQVSVFMATETRWPSYTPRHGVARDRGCATSGTNSN